MTRRRRAAPDPTLRCTVCRGALDPAATKAGGWVTRPDGAEVWKQTHTVTTHPACDQPAARTRTA